MNGSSAETPATPGNPPSAGDAEQIADKPITPPVVETSHIVPKKPKWVGTRTFVWVASRPAGQLSLRGVDRLLRVGEKTLSWFMEMFPDLYGKPAPGDSDQERVAESAPAQRPLTFWLFLPVFVIVFFIALNVRLFLGRSMPSMVLWIKARRHRLRAIRMMGNQLIRKTQSRTCPWTWGPISAVVWFLGFSKACAVEPSKPAVDVEPSLVAEKRKFSEVDVSEDLDQNVDEGLLRTIQKFCENYNSDTDSDFESPSSESDTSEDEEELATEEAKTELKTELKELLVEKEKDENEPSEKEAVVSEALVSENGMKVTIESDTSSVGPPTPVDKDGMALAGEFAGSPMPLAVVPSTSTSTLESKIARFFVPLAKLRLGKIGAAKPVGDKS